MSVETHREPAQSTDEPERREARGERVPFEGIVEVGGALGPSFEAQGVDVSASGMHLRTAYLPELAQPLTCRIELRGEEVLAAGEVVWRQEAARGGEFGLRFTDLDPASMKTLNKLLTAGTTFGGGEGARVRLHIDGLGSPMRARIRGTGEGGLVVGSDLGFLQVGKELELEDAKTGGKRAARIDRVGVEVNAETRIPQLVVSLRYDAPEDGPSIEVDTSAVTQEDTPEPSVIDGSKSRASSEPESAPREQDGEPLGPMRTGVGEAIHQASLALGPALARFGARAKATAGLVAARTIKARSSEAAAKPRRTTAPPPGGALHATGRKVVRGEPASAIDVVDAKDSRGVWKRRAALAASVGVASVLVVTALRRPAPTAQVAPAPPAESSAAGSPPPIATTPQPAPASAAPPAPGLPGVDDSALAADDAHAKRKPGKVAPFGNGPVGHANALHLKMDGPIEKIEGATTPTGFTVLLPARRSLEAAAPLASRDSRIASIRVTNEPAGAELAVSFKDGVPNYQVRAKGESLEILLAPVPGGKTTDVDDSPSPRVSHRKHKSH